MAKVKTIALPFESWFYLRTVQHEQRSETYKLLNKEHEKRKFDRSSSTCNGYKLVKSGDFGGCKGNPKNAYNEGRWTSWTLDHMKTLLEVAGLPYQEGETIESLNA